MFRTIIDVDIFLSEDTRLVKKVEKTKRSDHFPDGIRFALQYLYFKDDRWHQLARIDNYLHQGKPGAHIHLYKRKDVRFEEMRLEEAEERMRWLASAIGWHYTDDAPCEVLPGLSRTRFWAKISGPTDLQSAGILPISFLHSL